MQKVKLECDTCGAPLTGVDRPGVTQCTYCGRSYMIGDSALPAGEPGRMSPTGVKTGHPHETPAEQRNSPPSEELIAQIKAMLANGMDIGVKIQAIKLYRNGTGAGLKEAKDFVEDLAER